MDHKYLKTLRNRKFAEGDTDPIFRTVGFEPTLVRNLGFHNNTTKTGISVQGPLSLGGGADLILQSAPGSVDMGDIVFSDSSGTEIHRLWSGTGTLNYRSTSSGTSYAMIHTGNLPTQATRWPAWSEVTSKPSTFPPDSHTHNYLPNTSQSVDGKDMNTITETGFYRGYNMTNAAIQTISTFIVNKYSPDWIDQIQIITAATPQMYIRSRHSGTTWGAWKAVGGLSSVAWNDISSKPAEATRWPGWSEVTSKPTTATRWPTWSEVTSKPSTFAPSAHSHTGTSTTGSETTHTTAYGTIQLGPMNYQFNHIYGSLDKPFYFNKPILVNGIAVSMAGHTHGVTRTTLLGVTAFALNGTYNLGQSIQNFDLIIMYIGIYYNSSSDNNSQVVAFSPSSLDYGTVLSGGYNFGTNRQYGLFFPNATQIKCNTSVNLHNPRVKVEGIKYTS